MNAEEALKLCRYVAACCPQQKMDEFTPTVWADLLCAVRFEDAQLAVKSVLMRQPFIAPAEIIAEVKRIRAKRRDEHPPLTPPPDLTPLQTIAWIKEMHGRIGDGELIDSDAAYGVLKPRRLPELRALMPAPSEETDHA